MHNISEIIGKNIKKIRNKRGITIAELSNASGIRKEYLIKIENGTARKILYDKVCFIADALGVSKDEIFKGL